MPPARLRLGPTMDRRSFMKIAAGALAGCAVPLPVGRTLDVPIYRQQHALSCEAAALRMALGAHGTNVSEADILGRLAVDPTPRSVEADGALTWGDPDIGYVGA